MQKMDIIFEDVYVSAIRHKGLWRLVTEWRGKEDSWIRPIEMSLTDTKMGALLALMLDGEGENQNLLDEALILFSPDEIEKLTTAGLIP